MARTIQIRNVPDEIHQKLRVRAAEQRKSLSDLVLEELEEIASRPTMMELIERLETREPVRLDRPVSESITVDRRERDEQITSALKIGEDRSRQGSPD